MLTDTRARGVRIGSDAMLAAGLAVGLVVVAFVTAGGDGLAANTWAEIGLIALAAGLAGWLLLAGRRGPPSGAAAVALFAAVTVFTACSIAWSVTPDQSWIEAGRTLSYFAAFAGAAVLARLLPGQWRAVVLALALAATALAVWAVFAKVLTLNTGQQIQYGRLLTPFGYWNATGLMAALGLPPILWQAGRRGNGPIARGLSAPVIALLITVVVLSYSRSAVAAAILGSAVVVGCGQTRLRSVQMLALGGAGAAAVCGWAIGDHALTADMLQGAARLSLAARRSADRSFGIVVLVALVVTAAIGVAAAAATERRPLPEARRRMIGVALLIAVALIPVAALVALFASARGFTGEISHIWSSLTNPSGADDNPGRLVDLANSRPGYWRQAFSVGAHHLLAGAGAGSFGVAHLRYATAHLTGAQQVSHAHSYVMETFADFGLIGILLNLTLLSAWAAAARRTIGRPRPRPEHERERDAMVALLGVAVAFGVSSAIDWTWFYPGVAVPALVAAGWLAGRGAPDGAIGLRPAAARRLALGGRAVLGATAIGIAALALAYLVWQPLNSADADSAAIAATAGGTALTDARSAVNDFPVSLQAMEILSELEQAARQASAAQAELLHATRVQPENPYAWEALGDDELERGEFARALVDLRRAAQLDVTGVTDANLTTEIAEAAAKAR